MENTMNIVEMFPNEAPNTVIARDHFIGVLQGSQQEPALPSKLVRKPFESNHLETSLWDTSGSLSREESKKLSRPFPPSAAKPIGATWSC